MASTFALRVTVAMAMVRLWTVELAESIGSFKKWLDESMDRDDRWDG